MCINNFDCHNRNLSLHKLNKWSFQFLNELNVYLMTSPRSYLLTIQFCIWIHCSLFTASPWLNLQAHPQLLPVKEESQGQAQACLDPFFLGICFNCAKEAPGDEPMCEMKLKENGCHGNVSFVHVSLVKHTADVALVERVIGVWCCRSWSRLDVCLFAFGIVCFHVLCEWSIDLLREMRVGVCNTWRIKCEIAWMYVSRMRIVCCNCNEWCCSWKNVMACGCHYRISLGRGVMLWECGGLMMNSALMVMVPDNWLLEN